MSNWFASYQFKPDWFASFWFAKAFVPSRITPAGGGGGGQLFREHCVVMPNLFEGLDPESPDQMTPVIDCSFWAGDLFDFDGSFKAPKAQRPKPPAVPRNRIRSLEPVYPFPRALPGRVSECALCKFPQPMRDRFGPITVLHVYCLSRSESTGELIRHLG